MEIIKKGQNGYGYLVETGGLLLPKGTILSESSQIIKRKPLDLDNPILVAVMQKYGVENKNGRIYPKEILYREYERYLSLIEMGASAGETDHPEDSVISIKGTSMRITKLWWEGRTLMGEIYLPVTRGYKEMGICSHPADKIAHDIINGFLYGVSSRGVGSVKSLNGADIVQDDFELICWDFVTNPSTPNAWTATSKKPLEKFIEGSEPSKYERHMSSSMPSNKYSELDMFLKKYR